MINKQTIQAVIQTRDGRCEGILPMWLLQHLPVQNVLIAQIDEQLVVARNKVVEDFLLRTPFEHLLLVDDDMRPTHETLPLLEAEGDVVGAIYETPRLAAFARPDDVHCGALRISRQVLVEIGPPWFKFTYNQEGTRSLGCECNWLRDRAVEKRFKVLRAGYCQNVNRRSWCGPR